MEFYVLSSIKMETTSFGTQVTIGYYITSVHYSTVQVTTVQYSTVHVTTVEFSVLNSINLEAK